MSKKISLVLGSGGARGMAHVGVIRYLNEKGYIINSIAGCSMGALIGGVYAVGKLDEFERWLFSMETRDMIALLDITLGGAGFVKGERLMTALDQIIGNARIEDLPIAFTAVATNIEEEKEVWLQSGSLFDAIRASISLPLLFIPVSTARGKLIDGGVLNPVPIAPTFGDDTEMTIAVSLLGESVRTVEAEKEATAQESARFHERVLYSLQNIKQSALKSLTTDWAMYDVANQAFDTMQGAIARQKLAAYPPDALVQIPRNACGMLDFNRSREMVELGYRAASIQLDYLSRVIPD